MPDTNTTDAITAERARVADISRVIAQSRGLIPPGILDHLQDRANAAGWPADTLRGALWEVMTGKGASLVQQMPPPLPYTPDPNDPAVIRDAMAEAIACRGMHGYVPRSDRHAEFLDMRPTQMAAELLRLRGEPAPSRDPLVIVERALTTSSDFPAVLSAAANKMLLAGYRPAQPTYRDVFRRRDFRDFRPHRYLRAGDFPSLVALSENGEIQVGTLSESQEAVLLSTFARRIRVTRQMLVNDDLGAFTDFASMIGRRIADFENATAYALLNTANGDGPVLATGNAAVFSTGAARANKANAGSTLDLVSLAAGRAAIMRQRSLDGMPIVIGDRMRLLVGPNLEMLARQLTVPVDADQVTRENIFAGMIEPIVEPMIPGNRWYLLADAETAPVYVYGFLDGADAPQVSTGPIQGVDAVEISVLFDFGVGAVDWRGGWFNPGL
ncbi:MAG: Mu-like prophage major head subunit gpT family protein [Roseococcus sp.]|nr:Mu-like prophage major head subunit gpT family protein [Roseococcus sp.]